METLKLIFQSQCSRRYILLHTSTCVSLARIWRAWFQAVQDTVIYINIKFIKNSKIIKLFDDCAVSAVSWINTRFFIHDQQRDALFRLKMLRIEEQQSVQLRYKLTRRQYVHTHVRLYIIICFVRVSVARQFYFILYMSDLTTNAMMSLDQPVTFEMFPIWSCY
jgi:hypothetical protein